MIAQHPSGEPADQQLIAGINAGDDQAFEQLYHRHREWVFRMACRICGSEHHAQDVMQEVFRYFLGKFPGFELRCELRTFLYPAVRNLSLASLRCADPAASSGANPAPTFSINSPHHPTNTL